MSEVWRCFPDFCHGLLVEAISKSWMSDTTPVIKTLLAAGADPMARTTWGSTPLHLFAAVNENPAVIEALLAGGADLAARDEREQTPLHVAARANVNPQVIEVLLAAGAKPLARDKDGKTPWDLAQTNEKLKGSDAYWRLNEARYEASGSGSRRTPAARPSTDRNTIASAAGEPCLIPGYPSPPGGVANLGLSWCPATVEFQARAFALLAAGAQCAIATGSASTPEQIQARRQEIKVACERLAALGVSNCRCP